MLHSLSVAMLEAVQVNSFRRNVNTSQPVVNRPIHKFIVLITPAVLKKLVVPPETQEISLAQGDSSLDAVVRGFGMHYARGVPRKLLAKITNIPLRHEIVSIEIADH